MRLVYFGTSSFAVPALEAVAEQVVLVVSQPDRPAGRGRHLQSSPVKQAAERLGLLVAAPEKARSAEFVDSIRALGADALLVASYGQILSEDLLSAAKRGGINLHGSILPKYRGAAPIQRAILEDETETGITLMQMDKGMDTGDIIATERTSIGDDETAGELETRLAQIAAAMAAEWMPRIVARDYPRTPQDNALASVAAKMTPEDGRLHFKMSADEAYRRFRACTPRPGATLETAFGPLRIQECRRSDRFVVSEIDGEALILGFQDGALEVLKMQPAGRKSMSGAEFARGHRLKPGDSLVP